MINVSNEFKELMKQRQDFKGNAEVTLLNGTVLQLDEEDFSISNNGVVDSADANTVPLGAAICRNIQLELLNDDDHLKEYDFYGAKVRLYLTFRLSNTIEKIEFGTFTVTAPESYGSTVIVTAYDDMYKANAAYQTNLVFPAAAGAVLRDICTSCGIILASVSFLHDDFVIQEKPSSEYTFRQVIGFIAMIACGNARINRGGKLEILSYDLDFEKPHHELTEWISLTLDTSDITITGATTTRKITADDGTETEEVVEAGKKGYQIIVSNPLTKGSEQTLVSWIADSLSGIPFRKFTGDYITYPLAEFMDLAVLTDWRGNTYNTFLTDIDFVFFGITTMKNSAESGLRNQSAYNNEQAGTNVYFKELVEKEKTAREEAVQKLDETLKKGSGLYSTYVKQPDGSTISYFHDKPTVEESKNVIKITSDAIGVSNDGGKTYPYGFVLDGDLITRILYAEGINADYIDTGALTVRDEAGKILFMVDMDTKQVVIDGDHLRIGGQPLPEVIMDTKTIVLSLDNNYQSVPVDNEGNYDKFPDVTFRPTVHYGFEDITKDCIFTISKSDHVQGAWDNTSKTFKVIGLTADDGWVDVRATYLNRFTDLKRFTLAKVYAGAEGSPGKDGRTYILEASAQVIKVAKNNRVVPSYIDFYSKYQDGQSANRHLYKGRFRIRETADGKTWKTVYESAKDETSVRHNLYTFILTNTGNPILASNGEAISIYREIAQIEVTLYAAGGFTTMIDIQNIVTVKDVDNLSPEQVFDILTDYGKVQGIYKEGGQIYVNGEFIQSRGFRAVDRNGKVTFYINDNGEVTINARSLSISGQVGATQEYANGKANEALTYSKEYSDSKSKETLSSATKYADSSSDKAVKAQTQEFVFNKLTKNGTVQAIKMDTNGNIYINASYINTGVLSANYIKAGILQDANANFVINMETGNVTIKKGSINLGGNFIASAEGSVTIKKGSIAIGTFSVNTGGTVAITKGQINLGNGNFVVTDEGKVSIYNGNINIGGTNFVVTSEGAVTIKEGSINLGNNFIAKTDGTVSIKKGSINLGGNFIADTTGTVTMKKGVIGNWTISGNDLVGEYYTSSTMQAYQMRLSPSRGGGISWNENSKIIVNDGGDIVTYYGLVVNLRGYSDFGDGSGMFQLNGLGPSSSGGALVLKGSTVYYASSSSRRYKNYISDMSLEDAKRALDIPVVWFKYIRGYLQNSDPLCGKPIPGFFAEDVYDAIPEAAMLEDGKVEDWNYRVMIPIMMKLIQHLYERGGNHDEHI